MGTPPVEIRRSARRKRTLSARLVDGTVVVLVPAGMPPAEEAARVERLVARVLRAESRPKRRPAQSDDTLFHRAAALSEQLFEGRAQPVSVRWSDRMTTRWGSCTVATREIRIADQLKTMPDWVLDYVLVHELAHLLEPNHTARFWKLAGRYPRTERARGYLQGYVAAVRGGERSEDAD